jgi:hypothetical protein
MRIQRAGNTSVDLLTFPSPTRPMPIPDDLDRRLRTAAFIEVRRMLELRDPLTASDLARGFQFEGQRIPLINPQRGIFKPQAMKYALSIKTVAPKKGARVWYDDQRTAELIPVAATATSCSASRDHQWFTGGQAAPRCLRQSQGKVDYGDRLRPAVRDCAALYRPGPVPSLFEAKVLGDPSKDLVFLQVAEVGVREPPASQH